MNKYKVLVITNDFNGYCTILKEFELLLSDLDMATDIAQAYIDRFYKDAKLYIFNIDKEWTTWKNTQSTYIMLTL